MLLGWVLLLFLRVAWTAAVISGASVANGIVEIVGSGFGGEAQVEIYDTFDHAGADNGVEVQLDGPMIGAWTDQGFWPPHYDCEYSHSGNCSFLAWREDKRYPGRLTHDFAVPIQSFFVSFYVMIPPGYTWPGQTAPFEGFETGSSWKLTWFIDGSTNTTDANLCVPTHTGNGQFYIAGNDISFGSIGWAQNFWSWGKWTRMSAWISADPAAPTVNGRCKYDFYNDEFGWHSDDFSIAVFDDDGPWPKQYKFVNVVGWIRGFQDGEPGRPLYDDFYVASGLNAYARVELVNHETYRNASDFYILKVLSWSETTVVVELPASQVNPQEDWYVHVLIADGTNSELGVKVIEAGPQGSPTSNGLETWQMIAIGVVSGVGGLLAIFVLCLIVVVIVACVVGRGKKSGDTRSDDFELGETDQQ